jgi:hypothetical protein
MAPAAAANAFSMFSALTSALSPRVSLQSPPQTLCRNVSTPLERTQDTGISTQVMNRAQSTDDAGVRPHVSKVASHHVRLHAWPSATGDSTGEDGGSCTPSQSSLDGQSMAADLPCDWHEQGSHRRGSRHRRSRRAACRALRSRHVNILLDGGSEGHSDGEECNRGSAMPAMVDEDGWSHESVSSSVTEDMRSSTDTGTTSRSSFTLSPSKSANSWLGGMFGGAVRPPLAPAVLPIASPKKAATMLGMALSQLFFVAPQPDVNPANAVNEGELPLMAVAAGHNSVAQTNIKSHHLSGPWDVAEGGDGAFVDNDMAAATLPSAHTMQSMPSSPSRPWQSWLFGESATESNNEQTDSGSGLAKQADPVSKATAAGSSLQGVQAATDAAGTCAHIRSIVPDHFLPQVAALFGEAVPAKALQQEAGEPLGAGAAALLGPVEHAGGARHTEASRRFENVLCKEEERLGISYSAQRRLQRHGMYSYLTELRIRGTTATEMRHFLLDDDILRQATPSIACFERLLPPGKILPAPSTASALIYQRLNLPRPVGARQYVMCRRVWDREDGGFYLVTRSCQHEEGNALVASNRGSLADDFRGGYLLWCGHPCYSCALGVPSVMTCGRAAYFLVSLLLVGSHPQQTVLRTQRLLRCTQVQSLLPQLLSSQFSFCFALAVLELLNAVVYRMGQAHSRIVLVRNDMQHGCTFRHTCLLLKAKSPDQPVIVVVNLRNGHQRQRHAVRSETRMAAPSWSCARSTTSTCPSRPS